MTLVGLLIMGNASYFSIGCSKPDIVISCCGTLGTMIFYIIIGYILIDLSTTYFDLSLSLLPL
jgi:hypothetical protein